MYKQCLLNLICYLYYSKNVEEWKETPVSVHTWLDEDSHIKTWDVSFSLYAVSIIFTSDILTDCARNFSSLHVLFAELLDSVK